MAVTKEELKVREGLSDTSSELGEPRFMDSLKAALKEEFRKRPVRFSNNVQANLEVATQEVCTCGHHCGIPVCPCNQRSSLPELSEEICTCAHPCEVLECPCNWSSPSRESETSDSIGPADKTPAREIQSIDEFMQLSESEVLAIARRPAPEDIRLLEDAIIQRSLELQNEFGKETENRSLSPSTPEPQAPIRIVGSIDDVIHDEPEAQQTKYAERQATAVYFSITPAEYSRLTLMPGSFPSAEIEVPRLGWKTKAAIAVSTIATGAWARWTACS